MRFKQKTLRMGACLAIVCASVSPAQQDTVARRQQRSLDSLGALLRAVQSRLDSLERAIPSIATQAPATPTRAAGAYMNVGFDALVDGGWSTEKDVRSILKGDHDPLVRGFTIPNEEVTFDAAVDPYFKGFVNIVYKLDEHGESSVELEEAYGLTTSLPGNLQLKAGQMFAEFGRQNAQHPHSWSFIDQPIVLGQMFGPEGLRSQGLRVSWLAPTSWYTEAMVAVLNSAGGTNFSFRSDESSLVHGGEPVNRGVRSLGDMLIVPRLTSSVDLSDTQTLVAGLSGAFGPNNSGQATRTRILGADVYWKWKSPRAAAGFPFASFQAEGLLRTYDAAARQSVETATPTGTLPAETLRDRGGMHKCCGGSSRVSLRGCAATM